MQQQQEQQEIHLQLLLRRVMQVVMVKVVGHITAQVEAVLVQ
jgi:hypothetical protein